MHNMEPVMILLAIVSNVAAQYGFSDQSVLVQNEPSGRIFGFQNISTSDFYLGGLMRVHTNHRGVECSDMFTERGVEEVEAMLFAIDSVNNSPDLLTNIVLGYDIRDSCGSETVALDGVVDWALSSSFAANDQCGDVSSTGSLFLAAVGAYHSSVSAPVASFLRPFEVPQISYASASPVLSSRERYSYFLRTVPPDTKQSQVVVSMLKELGWKVVSAIYSNELYGEFGIETFRNLASQAGICLDLVEAIEEDFTVEEYAQLAQRIYDSTTAVILFYSLEEYVPPLLNQVSQIQPAKPFVWIATDAWAESNSIQEEFGDLLVGMLGLAPYNPVQQDFTQYYEQLTPATNTRNPYFSDYCTSFLSTIGETCTNTTSLASEAGFSPGTFDPFVIEAVYAVANGLQNFLTENCESPILWNSTTQSCQGQKKALSGSNLFDYISQVNFTMPTGARVEFNELGNPVEAMYKILNLQKTASGTNELIFIGTWDSIEGITFKNTQEIQYGLTASGSVITSFESECPVCSSGEVQMIVVNCCCNECIPCLDNLYSNSTMSTECLECGENMWGNNPLNGSNGCIALEELYLDYASAWGIVISLMAVVGLALVAIVSVLVAFFWKSVVVKTYGRELMVLLLVGLTSLFVLPFFYLAKPSLGVCLIRLIGLRLSLMLVFAVLLIKSIEVAFFSAHQTRTGRKVFIKPLYRVVLVLLFVIGQMILIIISLIVTQPEAYHQLMYSSVDDIIPSIVLSCTPANTIALILMILYEFLMVIFFSGFAISIIRFAYKCNETRQTTIVNITVSLIWLIYVHVYFANSDNAIFQAGVTVVETLLIAFTIILSLLFPQLYITFMKQKSNLIRHTDLTNTSSIMDEDSDTTFSRDYVQNDKSGKSVGEDGLISKMEPLIADDEN